MANPDGTIKRLLAKADMFQVALAAFTIYGVVCKLLLSLNLSLNSDTIVPGVLSMEIGRNGNYLLKGLILNSMDSQLFEDIVPFHLVPQILTDFSPDALRLTTFFIYLSLVVVCSYLVFCVTKNKTSMLVFAALMANLCPLSYSYFEAPMSHIAAILFSCVFIIILFPGHRLAFINSDRRRIIAASALFVAIFLFTFSDLMFAAFFVLPFTVCYLLFYGKKGYRSSLLVALTLLSSALALIFSRYLVNALDLAHFITLHISLTGRYVVLVNITLYFKGLLLLVSGNLLNGINDAAQFGYGALIAVLLFLAVGYFTLKNILKDDNDGRKFLLAFFVLSSAVVAVPYIFTTLCVNIYTTRYLTFTALAIFLLIALYFDNKNKALVVCILLILIIFSLANFNAVNGLDYHPNKAEYGLISYLKQNNLTFGYSDYWNANIITYLSHGDVTVRAVNVSADGLRPVMLNSAAGWYEDEPGTYFLLIKQARPDLVNASSLLIDKHAAAATYQSNGYIIYLFTSSAANDNMLLFPSAAT